MRAAIANVSPLRAWRLGGEERLIRLIGRIRLIGQKSGKKKEPERLIARYVTGRWSCARLVKGRVQDRSFGDAQVTRL